MVGKKIKKKMKTVLVYAGNLSQFLYYLQYEVKPKTFTIYSSGTAILDGKKYLYVSDVLRTCRGIQDAELVLYGTWLERKDVGEMRTWKERAEALGILKKDARPS